MLLFKVSGIRKILYFLSFLSIQQSFAGPPFITDDPEPVEFKHWEYYISSIGQYQKNLYSGTLPHFEVNYGLISNVQVHLILPINYNYINNRTFQSGYADTEFGIKYRFVQETDNMPQISTFPIVEIPTIKDSRFSNGKTQLYLPIWIQKSWNKLTTYGGAGYWINPGTNNKNWIFAGWEIQYDFSKLLTLGGELYYYTATTTDSRSSVAFNLGGFINFSEKVHIIFSFGHNLTNDNFFTSYAGLLWTI